MSRIGKMPVQIPDNVETNISEDIISVKGPLGELSFRYSSLVSVSKQEEGIVVKPLKDESKALWGTTRSVINNMVIGVSEGYKKSLEITGVGYKFEINSNKLVLSIGYSHKVNIDIPDSLKVVLNEKEKNVIHISGIDKQFVGEFASKIKAKKKPEPYKGKGIKYVGEYIRRKAGKTGKK